MGKIAIPGTLTSAVNKPVVEALEVYDNLEHANQLTLNTTFVKKVPGKGLSTNDYTNADKAKLDNLPTGEYINQELQTVISQLIDTFIYNSTTKYLQLKHGNTLIAEVDASAFIKDGMVSKVEIVNGNLIITFNTDSGKETITIPISDIFDASNYYNKDAIDSLLQEKQDVLTPGTGITIENNVISSTSIGQTYTAGNGLDLNYNEFSVDTTTIATKLDINTLTTKIPNDVARYQTDVSLVYSTGPGQFTPLIYIRSATSTMAGVLTAADKSKLDTMYSLVPSAASSSNQLADLAYVLNLLSGVINSTIPSSAKGTSGGVAELDSNGKVPISQLPSYVDDVVEYASLEEFPLEGESGKIYLATNTNKGYRWGGSTYVEISSSLALGTTSSTAYRGDYGLIAYMHASDPYKIDLNELSGLYKIAVTSEGHIQSVTAVLKADITALGIPAQDTTYSTATTQSDGLMSSQDKADLTTIVTTLTWE